MAEAIAKLVVTVPAAAAVIVTAWIFLRSMKELNGEWSKMVKELHETQRQDRREANECIRDNTTALRELREATKEIARENSG